MMSDNQPTPTALFPLLLIAALSACGGGGGGAETASETTAVVYRTSSSEPVPVPVPVQHLTVVGEVVPSRPLAAENPDRLTGFDAGEEVRATPDPQMDKLTAWSAKAPTFDAATGVMVYRDPKLLSVQYEGGTESQRFAAIASDPIHPDNKVLLMVAREPNVADANGILTKARVQVNAYDQQSIRSREIGFSVRMYLSPDFDQLRSLPKSFEWLAISEWWNNASWTRQPYPFRITMNIAKPSAAVNSPLAFGVSAQTLDVASNTWNEMVWSQTNRQVSVPIGKWVTLEYFFREGNATSGRFHVALTPDGGQRQVLFDITNWTHHPEDPAPDGLTEFNPMKLYSGLTVMRHIMERKAELRVAWDDPTFRICREFATNGASPCAPAGVN